MTDEEGGLRVADLDMRVWPLAVSVLVFTIDRFGDRFPSEELAQDCGRHILDFSLLV